MYSLGAMPACVSSFDLKQMTKYFIEIVINDAFEKNISVKMKIDNSFPEDVSGNLKALRCLFIEIFYFLIQKCSNTEVNVVAKLKVLIIISKRTLIITSLSTISLLSFLRNKRKIFLLY
jgi:hypothetical protein